jgi:uncharacterized protein (DUF58 family)
VAAERVASTVALGVHGRRRVGQGDSFWQFRPFVAGDAVSRIDWHQSAKSDRAYVRETEWEAAQTVALWCDTSPSMSWRSRNGLPEKGARAQLLMLALASLLLRGGERITIIGRTMRPVIGRVGLERLAEHMQSPEALEAGLSGLPITDRLPTSARVVLFGDFLGPLAEMHAVIARLAGIPVSGFVMQVIDPAEEALPFSGRVRFSGLEREPDEVVPRVEGVRSAYAERFVNHQGALSSMCTAVGFGFATHRTDHAAEAALLVLYSALADR